MARRGLLSYHRKESNLHHSVRSAASRPRNGGLVWVAGLAPASSSAQTTRPRCWTTPRNIDRRGGGSRTPRSFAPDERTAALLPRRSSPHPRHRVAKDPRRARARLERSRRGHDLLRPRRRSRWSQSTESNRRADGNEPSRCPARTASARSASCAEKGWASISAHRPSGGTASGAPLRDARAQGYVSVTGIEPVFLVGETSVLGHCTTPTSAHPRPELHRCCPLERREY